MKNIITMLMMALTVWSCSEYDDSNDYYNPEHYSSPVFYLPLVDADDVASIYGTANGYSNISVIASGSMFEVSGLPQDIFLAPFPGGSINASDNSISVLRDEIPYTHEEYKYYNPNKPWDSYIKFISFKISFPEHTMTYNVKEGNENHTVCVTFGEAEGKTEFMPVFKDYYWLYQFTMDIIRMTVDGEERPVPEKHSIEYKLYYNRSKDNIG